MPHPVLAGEEALRNVRAALGYASLSSRGAILLQGTATHCAAGARYSLLFSPRGELRRQVEGPVPEQLGYDGAAGWATDWTGMPRRLELGELEAALTDLYTPGTFGAGRLGPARVVFDYPRRRVAILGGA